MESRSSQNRARRTVSETQGVNPYLGEMLWHSARLGVTAAVLSPEGANTQVLSKVQFSSQAGCKTPKTTKSERLPWATKKTCSDTYMIAACQQAALEIRHGAGEGTVGQKSVTIQVVKGLTCSDVVPIWVVRRKLLVGSGLHEVHPTR